jgi:hypothetical protein
VSRIRIGAAWAVAIALASFAGACGGGSGGDEITVASNAGPREVAEIAGLRDVHSGNLEASLVVTKLKRKESISLRLTAGFKRLGEGDLPQAYVATTSQGLWNGRKIDFDSLLLVLSGKAMVSYGSAGKRKSYEIELSALEELKSKLDQARAVGGEGNLAACLEAAGEFNLDQLVRDPEIEGRRKESDGTGVILINGAVDLPRLHDLLVSLAEDPGCGAQMEALGLPSASALEGARVDFKKGFEPRLKLAVDRHGVLRELTTRFECARLNGELFELELTFGLKEVNQATEVYGSVEGESLDSLLRRFGTTKEAVLGADASEAVIGFLEGLGGVLSGRKPQGS